MDASKHSEIRRSRDFSDAFVVFGILAMTAGAWIERPSAGLILLGAALVLIGARGSAVPGG
jgi:hypothetical protein